MFIDQFPFMPKFTLTVLRITSNDWLGARSSWSVQAGPRGVGVEGKNMLVTWEGGRCREHGVEHLVSVGCMGWRACGGSFSAVR